MKPGASLLNYALPADPPSDFGANHTLIMLESFRKYTGLMFVVLILLFVGLVFFGSTGQSFLAGEKVIYAHGKGYSQLEVKRFSEQPARMLTELSRAPGGYQAVGSFLFQMGLLTHMGAQLENDQVFEFLVNRASLKRGMTELGVIPSTAEVEQYLEEELFWQDGAFNEQAYSEFTNETLNKLGMSVKQMNDLVGEIIAFEKLGEILGAGVDASREAVLSRHLNNTQRIGYNLVSLPLAQFKEQQMPTEEELKAYWEEHKANYLSEPKRRITYVLARPDYAALEDELYPDEGSQPDAREGDEEAEADTPPSDSKLTEEDRKKAVIDLAARLDDLFDRLKDANGKGFEKLAQDLGFEVTSTELVTRENLPAELQATLADVPGQTQTAAEFIFAHQKGIDPMSSIGDIKKVGSDQWLFFRLDEAVEPVELTYDEAKEEVRSDLISESARDDLEEAAKEKRAALQEAIAAGKSFEEAAKELELSTTSHPDTTRPSGSDAAALSAFNLAAQTNPGELSEVEVETSDEADGVNRAIFVYVDKREVYENENLDTLIDRQLDQVRERQRNLALANWFAEQRAEADVRFP